MNIEKIIYETTREVLNLEDKLRIATVFLFCEKVSSIKLAELLYTDNHEKFINDLNKEYIDYEVDFTINLNQSNVKSSFYKTLSKVTEQIDKDGYLKALFDKDEFALVINEIVNYNFDNIELKKFTKNLTSQLTLDFNI